MLHSSGMRLAPGIFMRGNIGGFAKIGGARILCCVQVAHVQPGSGVRRRRERGHCGCWRSMEKIR